MVNEKKLTLGRAMPKLTSFSCSFKIFTLKYLSYYYFCVPESFNTNISQKLFDYFVNSQHENTNSKGNFVLKNQFETFVFKDLKMVIISKHFILPQRKKNTFLSTFIYEPILIKMYKNT